MVVMDKDKSSNVYIKLVVCNDAARALELAKAISKATGFAFDSMKPKNGDWVVFLQPRGSVSDNEQDRD
jgi:hypothetical protein